MLLTRVVRTSTNSTRRIRSFTQSFLPRMRIVPVPVRSDNYAYLLIDELSQKAVAVDPYDVSKVAKAVEDEGVQIVGGLTTHHHHDHSGGNQAFVSEYPGVPIYGGSEAVPALTHLVKDGDEFVIGDNIKVKCLATPCHTQDSICYYVTATNQPLRKGVFTGDTLFQAGCGRFFEGDGQQMHKALTYLQTLPDDTVVYNGHEYTKTSVAFALSVDPDNAELQALSRLQMSNDITAGKTTMGDEKKYNPFMRLSAAPIQQATGHTRDDISTITKLREMKNSF